MVQLNELAEPLHNFNGNAKGYGTVCRTPILAEIADMPSVVDWVVGTVNLGYTW